MQGVDVSVLEAQMAGCMSPLGGPVAAAVPPPTMTLQQQQQWAGQLGFTVDPVR